MLPRLFIGSSVESLPVADAVQENLEHDADVTVWDQDVFAPSTGTVEAILDALDKSDFGLFILSADDSTKLRGRKVHTPRDNTVFELGVFAGRLGLKRTFFMSPSDCEHLHLPTDLLGITPLRYKAGRTELVSAVGPACNQIRRAFDSMNRVTKAPGRRGSITILSNVNEGSHFAATRVKVATTVRVVGTARQDVIGGLGIAAAHSYLEATERRFRSKHALGYMRITSSQLTARFKQHLGRLFELSRSNAAIKFEVALTPTLNSAVSYMVFDDDGVLLIVDNNIGPVRDNQLMFWCTDKDVVRVFTSHFDGAWSVLPDKLRSKSALDRSVTLRK